MKAEIFTRNLKLPEKILAMLSDVLQQVNLGVTLEIYKYT